MGKEKNEKVTINAAKVKFLKDIGIGEDMSISDIVDIAISFKEDLDRIDKNVEAFKKFFKEIGEIGACFEGEKGTVKLSGKAATAVEPLDLQNLLSNLDRADEFMGMVSVKIKDTREKLGTVLFNKIADIVPNASIAVTIGKKK